MTRRFAFALLLAASVAGQTTYQKPPQAVLDVLNAPVTPIASVSPAKTHMLLLSGPRYPSIADQSRPILRLAGLRIDPATNGLQKTSFFDKVVLKDLSTSADRELTLPAGARLAEVRWSPDGRHIAASNMTANGIELWIAPVATGALKQVRGITLNAVLGDTLTWMPDNKSLLVQTVPAGRAAAPARAPVPPGPNAQESLGKSAPVWTFQDLLKDAHDEALFEHYATAQLAFVDLASGKVTTYGKPGLYLAVEPAPDGNHILTARIHKPFSYLHPAPAFPKEVEVWDRTAKVVYKVASLPLADRVPIDGVPTGPRGWGWRQNEPATLVWTEAMDGGNPKEKVPHRDRVLFVKAPFKGEPAELVKTEHRFRGLMWGQDGGTAFYGDYDRDKRWVRQFVMNANNPAEPAREFVSRNMADRYRDIGSPLMKTLPSGATVIAQNGDNILLAGTGATPKGDRPFLRRMNLKTRETQELFRCGDSEYEFVVAVLADDGSRFITRRESPGEPPNYYLRTVGQAPAALTKFADPAPALRKIKKELVVYKRPDGVQLSFTLYLPPDYKPGTRLPAVVWAYPLEYTDADVAGQIVGSTQRFTTIAGSSHLFYLLAGYAILDGASMPVVGTPEKVNDTYIEQVVSSAKAAIGKAAEMGVIDPKRVGVGGHSYGAFMTANLLAHSDLFRAGVARSGAYNRTLTPFGFQSERRTFWEAVDVYTRMSPFFHAHKIKEPLLLIHGEMDNNAGTHPIQSDRMYQAVRGNGGIVRYVTLPYESHGYAAKESIEHTLHEMISWFDKHVKNAE
ncbi:MAG: prolyl oligopeptidase family serine peptidase [Bryobacteraceae bacterium]|nr:prolyl oligopeptidase family serine peptidase [Bryobacteraceae bacterium]